MVRIICRNAFEDNIIENITFQSSIRFWSLWTRLGSLNTWQTLREMFRCETFRLKTETTPPVLRREITWNVIRKLCNSLYKCIICQMISNFKKFWQNVIVLYFLISDSLNFYPQSCFARFVHFTTFNFCCLFQNVSRVFHDKEIWRISVRISDRSKVTQIKINFIKNCPQWGLNSQPPDHQSHALLTVLVRNLLEIYEVSFLLFHALLYMLDFVYFWNQ